MVDRHHFYMCIQSLAIMLQRPTPSDSSNRYLKNSQLYFFAVSVLPSVLLFPGFDLSTPALNINVVLPEMIVSECDPSLALGYDVDS